MKHFLFTQSLSRTRVESTLSTKKPPCAQQESQCARRLKERIAQKGGLKSLFYFFKKKYLMLFLIKYAPAIAISPKYKGVADIAPPPPPSDE